LYHYNAGTCPEGTASLKAAKGGANRMIGGHPATVYGSKDAFECSQKRRRWGAAHGAVQVECIVAPSRLNAPGFNPCNCTYSVTSPSLGSETRKEPIK
jgi:hypothetical protein